MLTIRSYEPPDETGWLRCRVLSFLDTALFDAVEREKQRYEHPAIELVADEDGAIVGLLDVEHGFEPGTVLADRPGAGGMIWHLAVHPDHRRRGVAAALLDEAERRAREQGLLRLEAWTRDDAHATPGTSRVGSSRSTATSTCTSSGTKGCASSTAHSASSGS